MKIFLYSLLTNATLWRIVIIEVAIRQPKTGREKIMEGNYAIFIEKFGKDIIYKFFSEDMIVSEFSANSLIDVITKVFRDSVDMIRRINVYTISESGKIDYENTYDFFGRRENGHVGYTVSRNGLSCSTWNGSISW